MIVQMELLIWVGDTLMLISWTPVGFFTQTCHVWFPIYDDLHRFFIAVDRVVVNNDDNGGTALDPTVWSAGTAPKKRKVDRVVRDSAWLPGPVILWTGGWQGWPDIGVTRHDVAVWLYFMVLVLFFVQGVFPRKLFAGLLRLLTLVWAGRLYVELLVVFELWAGERLKL